MKSQTCSLIVLLACSAYVSGQELCVTIVDSVVTLRGEIRALAGIEVTSQAGFLSRAPGVTKEGIVIPGQGSAPWPFGEVSFLAQTPNQFAYGILGEASRIDVSGDISTAALFSESLELAKEDLAIQLGVGGDPLPPILPCREEDERFASVIDGVLVLHGSFDQLAGISVTSAGGHLSRDAAIVGGVSVPGQSHAPFAFGTGNFLVQSPGEFAYGVLGAENTVDVEGITTTAILYGGAPGTEAADLEFVELGIDGNATPVAFPVVPEPTGGCMAWAVAIGALLVRRRR